MLITSILVWFVVIRLLFARLTWQRSCLDRCDVWFNIDYWLRKTLGCLIEHILLLLYYKLLRLIEIFLQVEFRIAYHWVVSACLGSWLLSFRLRARHRLVLSPLLFWWVWKESWSSRHLSKYLCVSRDLVCKFRLLGHWLFWTLILWFLYVLHVFGLHLHLDCWIVGNRPSKVRRSWTSVWR